MCSDLNYDEEQYIAGAHFARSLAPYRDFLSMQPPVYTWLAGGVLALLPGWQVLAARLLVWLCAFGACVAFASLARVAGTGRVAAVLLVLGLAASPFMAGPLSNSRNDILPILFLLLGLRLLFVPGLAWTHNTTRFAAAGLLIALAAATKYTYLFAAPAVGAVLVAARLVRPWRETAPSRRALAAFMLGAAAGVLPLVHALTVDPALFVFATLSFHTTAALDWYRVQGYGYMSGWTYKAVYAARRIASWAHAPLLVFALGAVAGLAVRARRASARGLPRPQTVLLLLLFAGACVFAYLPTPSHAMYFAPAAVTGTLLLAALYASARAALPAAATTLVACLAVLGLLARVQALAFTPSRLADVAGWTPMQVHRFALAVAEASRGAGPGGVATLFPATVLDANRVPPQFATGPFMFRSAYLYTADELVAMHAAGPQTLAKLLDPAPPAAIVGGFVFRRAWQPPMDQALMDYARAHGYRRTDIAPDLPGYGGGEVWVRTAPTQ